MTKEEMIRPLAEPDLDAQFKQVVAAFAADAAVMRGRMMFSYGLKVKGKIFAMFGRGRFVTKLPKTRVDELVGLGKGERFDPGHGRVMKEWIAMKAGEEEWLEVAREAYLFVRNHSLRQEDTLDS